MPWKIKNTTNLNDPADPILHMWDHTVNVNLVTHLDSGVVDLYVGADNTREASVWITIDVDRTPVVRLEETSRPPNGLDLPVIVTVLETMGHSTNILSPLYRKSRRQDSRMNGAISYGKSPHG